LTNDSKTEMLLSESRNLRDMFNEVIQPHRHSLWHYCLRLTASPWDAEDLFQETLLKAFATLPQLTNPIIPKSYLFRIATNSWIDSCRKRNVPLDELEEESIASAEVIDPLEIREAIETLVSQLKPRQILVLLLMDVFEFSANDVSNMVHCSPGAVYAILRRARSRLRALLESNNNTETISRSVDVKEIKAKSLAVERIIRALNTGNIAEFLGAMSDHVHNDAAPGFQEFSKQEIRRQSGQELPSGLRATYYELWGREVILVLADTDSGPTLHNIAYPIVEGDEIVYFRGYYFCKELLFEVGQRLGIPVQKNKMPVNWDKV